MKHRIALLLLFVVTLCVGCGGRVTMHQLEQLEAQLDTAPDSVLTVLTATDMPRRGEARALYALLTVQAQDKNYIDVADDSLIRVATRYYDRKGFVPQEVTLEKGQLIDRYGATSQYSDFVGDPNVTIPQRSLSPYTNTSEYTLYQVAGDVNALKGPIAPAFKQPGGGIQYKLEVPISYLIKEGKLIIIYHSK